ncbi:hypothetical protein CRG98_026595 [Punica granatum]|uniref:Uncharacterized protein n=1 Tax=Punica granatum TaxID=22663 RepID=A0A2I0J9S4_PUNGR|nr:hypothetical protein CRG98_026595 [Punica granatum]
METADAQLIHIKITSAGLWFRNETEFNEVDVPVTEKLSGARRGKVALKFWNIYTEPPEYQAETSYNGQNSNPVLEEGVGKASKEDPHYSFILSAKETLRAAVFHFGRKWHRRLSFIWRHVRPIAGSFWKLWNIAGVRLNLLVPRWLQVLPLDRLNSYADVLSVIFLNFTVRVQYS